MYSFLLNQDKLETGALQESVVICGELQRTAEGWKFQALGEGCAEGLRGLVRRFGVRA